MQNNPLPETFRPLLWSYDFSRIDPLKHKKTIIVSKCSDFVQKPHAGSISPNIERSKQVDPIVEINNFAPGSEAALLGAPRLVRRWRVPSKSRRGKHGDS